MSASLGGGWCRSRLQGKAAGCDITPFFCNGDIYKELPSTLCHPYPSVNGAFISSLWENCIKNPTLLIGGTWLTVAVSRAGRAGSSGTQPENRQKGAV